MAFHFLWDASFSLSALGDENICYNKEMKETCQNVPLLSLICELWMLQPGHIFCTFQKVEFDERHPLGFQAINL